MDLELDFFVTRSERRRWECRVSGVVFPSKSIFSITAQLSTSFVAISSFQIRCYVTDIATIIFPLLHHLRQCNTNSSSLHACKFENTFLTRNSFLSGQGFFFFFHFYCIKVHICCHEKKVISCTAHINQGRG